jgi:hypothetical protein
MWDSFSFKNDIFFFFFQQTGFRDGNESKLKTENVFWICVQHIFHIKVWQTNWRDANFVFTTENSSCIKSATCFPNSCELCFHNRKFELHQKWDVLSKFMRTLFSQRKIRAADVKSETCFPNSCELSFHNRKFELDNKWDVLSKLMRFTLFSQQKIRAGCFPNCFSKVRQTLSICVSHTGLWHQFVRALWCELFFDRKHKKCDRHDF